MPSGSELASAGSVWRQELRRILNSRKFSRAKQLRDLLVWLVDQVESGHHDRLNEYDAALHLKARDDHDPALQSDVRKLLSRLRRKLGEYYAEEAAGNAFQIRLPGGFEPRLIGAVRPVAPASACERLPRRPRSTLLHFAGLRASRDADADLVHAFEAELAYQIGSEGGIRLTTRNSAGAAATLQGRAWGAEPVHLVLQLVEHDTGVLMSQTRVELRSDPGAAARRVVRDLGITSLAAASREAGAAGKHELERNHDSRDPE